MINIKKIKGEMNLYLNDLFLSIVLNLDIKRAYADKKTDLNKINFLIFPASIRLWILIPTNFSDFKNFVN
jgi:hypothetical protein